MSNTHKQKAAKKLAESLHIPYQRALLAIEKSLAGTYPKGPRLTANTGLAPFAPEFYAEWAKTWLTFSSNVNHFFGISGSYGSTISELEELAATENEVKRLLYEMAESNPFTHLVEMDRLIDRAVVLAAAGIFEGFTDQRTYCYVDLWCDSMWAGLERQGFAEPRDPDTDPNGYSVALNKAGSDAFLMSDGTCWNLSMMALFEPCLSVETHKQWVQQYAEALKRQGEFDGYL
jgi:hypothetical protein